MKIDVWYNGKATFVVYLKNPNNREKILDRIKNIILPDHMKAELIFAYGKTASEAFSKVHDDAYLKFFMIDSILEIYDDIWKNIGYVLVNSENVRLIGLLGSEIPLNADISNATSIFGSYTYSLDEENATRDNFQEIYVYQEVQCLDPSFMILLGDIKINFDPKISDEFLGAAMCCELKKQGFTSAVMMPFKDHSTIITDKPSIYSEMSDEYEKHRQYFFNKYKKDFLPLVSILIPSYNQPKYFKRALLSALAQDYPNIEILVGDDSTDDRVEKLIKPYLKEFKNIFYEHHQQPLGFNGRGNMQRLLNIAKGEFIQFLYHDDLLLPQKISTMMQYFQADLVGEIGLISSARKLIDPDDNFLRSASIVPSNDIIIDSQFLTQSILMNFSNGIGELTTVLFRKKDLYIDYQGKYRIGNFLGMQDDSMWDVSTFLEICRKRNKIIYLKDFYSAMRLHEEQNSQNPNVIATLVLDFLGFALVAYAYKIHIDSKEKFLHSLNRWYDSQQVMRSNQILTDWQQVFEEESTEEIRLLKKIIHSIEEKNIDDVIHYELLFLSKKDGIDEFMEIFCRKENDRWKFIRKD